MDDVNSNEGTNFVTLSFMKLLYLQLEQEIKTGNILYIYTAISHILGENVLNYMYFFSSDIIIQLERI